MKKIDFSQPGKMPLTQDRLKYLQDAYTESINGLTAAFKSSTVPVRISGMTSSFSIGVTTITAGWFFYNDELIRFSGGGYSAIMVGNAAYVVISQSASSLTYNDGSTPNVILDKTGTIAILPATTPTDSTHFLLSDLKSAAVALAEENENYINTPYLSPAYAGGFVADASSPIKYRKSKGSKTVRIKGVTAYTLPVGVSTDTVIFVLPIGYRPAETQIFPAFNRFNGSVTIRVKTNGEVSLAGDLAAQSTEGCWLNIAFDID